MLLYKITLLLMLFSFVIFIVSKIYYAIYPEKHYKDYENSGFNLLFLLGLCIIITAIFIVASLILLIIRI